MTTNMNELLFGHHIDNLDYEGASQHAPSAAEQLRQSADKYLDDAVTTGEVTKSRIFMSKQLGKFVGYTTVETISGVKIIKTSQGDFTVSAEYEERGHVSDPSSYQDLDVKIELPANGEPTVHEDRRKVVDFEDTGESGSRTLSRSDSNRAMGEVTKLIWQTFE